MTIYYGFWIYILYNCCEYRHVNWNTVMALRHIFCLVFLILLCSSKCSLSVHRKYIGNVHSDLNDIFFEHHVVLNIHGSLIMCMIRCISKVECKSFSYKPLTNECVGISVGYTKSNANIGDTSLGWIYFLVLDGK